MRDGWGPGWGGLLPLRRKHKIHLVKCLSGAFLLLFFFFAFILLV